MIYYQTFDTQFLNIAAPYSQQIILVLVENYEMYSMYEAIIDRIDNIMICIIFGQHVDG